LSTKELAVASQHTASHVFFFFFCLEFFTKYNMTVLLQPRWSVSLFEDKTVALEFLTTYNMTVFPRPRWSVSLIEDKTERLPF
jgi:hypothetical protein